MKPLAKSTAPNALNHWGLFFVQGVIPLNCGLGRVVAMQDLTPISRIPMFSCCPAGNCARAPAFPPLLNTVPAGAVALTVAWPAPPGANLTSTNVPPLSSATAEKLPYVVPPRKFAKQKSVPAESDPPLPTQAVRTSEKSEERAMRLIGTS